MNDTIYRRDAIQALVDTEEIKGFAYRMLEDRLMEIPSADKKGEWIHAHVGTIAEGLYCSNCGKHGYGEKYCPNCGADMRYDDNERHDI